MLSIPIIGTWVAFLIFGGPFPGDVIIGRFYIAHVLLIPAILAALIGAHLALVVRQKHTQFPQAGRTEHQVSVSVGIAHSPPYPFDEVVRRADEAMYRAKQAGGGRLGVA